MKVREVPLIVVECCTRYVVSEMHLVPPCPKCEEIPQYLADTTWWLGIDP